MRSSAWCKREKYCPNGGMAFALSVEIGGGRRSPPFRLRGAKTSVRTRNRSFDTLQGRFLILARADVVEPNLVWKDTVLVRSGETVTSCSTSPTRAAGWLTATSPSTTRAG
jgi:hypothetical protein